MSAQSMPSPRALRVRPRSTTWMTAKPLWAGLSIISMWLAVLFVGVLGGDIRSTSAGGSTSSVPVVVVVAGVALIATYAIGRRAFASFTGEDELRTELEDEKQAREQLAADVAELKAGAS